MKNIFLVLIIFLSSQTVFGQWEKQFYVDENGVPTKDSYESLRAWGTFSNAQAKEQDASYIFIKDEASITVKIFEYNTEVPSTSQASFQDVVLTKPDGNVAKIKRVFFTKKGALFFSKGKFCEKDQICLWHLLESWVVNKDKFADFIKQTQNPGTYTMVFDRTVGDTKNNYKATFTL